MCARYNHTYQPLHSNMFLLILPRPGRRGRPAPHFTFQYVSINTCRTNETALIRKLTLHSNMFLLIHLREKASKYDEYPLHSNMFLLIQEFAEKLATEYLTLHSNMFLLIRSDEEAAIRYLHSFTFQYVSINTSAHLQVRQLDCSLHSNMFLLIPSRSLSLSMVLWSLHSNMFLLIQ